MTHLFLADTVTPSEQDCSSLGKLERKQVRLREAEAEGRGSLWNVWVFGIGVRGQEWGWAGSRHFLEWLGSDRSCRELWGISGPKDNPLEKISGVSS